MADLRVTVLSGGSAHGALERNRLESEPGCERHPCRRRPIHRHRTARQDRRAGAGASRPRSRAAPPRAPRASGTESVIAAELTIEGKIVGAGDVRIAGRFKGDVQVDGNFRIDAGARLEGQVRAGVVVVGGELQGNIDAAKQVDVLSTGVIVGDVKAASITVAAGSRMRGHVEFGWDEKHSARWSSRGHRARYELLASFAQARRVQRASARTARRPCWRAAAICPGCRHHLRFGPRARAGGR